MRGVLERTLIVFEIILTIVITNVIIIIGSTLSLLTLLPVMIVSTMNYLRRLYIYQETGATLFTFFAFMKGKFILSFKTLYPIIILLLILLSSMLYFDQILFETMPAFVIWFIFIIQGLLTYELIGILVIASLRLTKKEVEKPRDILKNAFLLFNATPFRSFLANLSMVSIFYFIYRIVPFYYLFIIPVSLFGFYIVYSDVYERDLI